MATKDGVSAPAADDSREGSFWRCALLGICLISAGVLVLADLALAAAVSTVAIASAAILAGGFEVAHAFWTKRWGAFAWQTFLGTLYMAFGIALISRPDFSAVVLVYVLGLILITSGLVRIFLSLRYGRLAGWLLGLSGIIGVVAGAVILTRWPVTGLWVIGLALGVDLILHGAAWLAVAWRLTREPSNGADGAAQTAGTANTLSEQP